MRTTRKQTAYHEAGHAVIGRVLTCVCGGATIKPDYKKGTRGRAKAVASEDEWEKRGKFRTFRAGCHAQIMLSMAGAEAEKELFGRQSSTGDGDDRLQIARVGQEIASEGYFWESLEPRLRRMTRMLVRRHRALIERVAKALLAKTELSADELDELVGKSVANAVATMRRPA